LHDWARPNNEAEIDKTVLQPEQNEPPKLQRLRPSEAEISGIDNTRTESPPAYPPPPGVISSEEELAKKRTPTIHPSKKTQAFKRPRGPDGRFIRADDVTHMQRSQNQYQGLHVDEKGNSLGQTKPDQKNTKTKTFEAEHLKRTEPYNPRPMQRIASGTVGTGEKASESLQKEFPPIKQEIGAKGAELYTSQSLKGHGAALKKIGERIHADMGRYSTSSSAKTPNTITPTLPFATDSSVLPPYRPTSIRQIFQPKRVSSHDSYIAEEVGN
jgi:hypothetical protein